MGLSVAKLQSAGAGSGLETKGSALGARLSVLVDFTAAAAAAAAVHYTVNARMIRCVKIRNNTKTGRLERTRRVAARPEAASVASDPWVLRLVQRTGRVSSRRQTTTTAAVSWSPRLLKYLHVRTTSRPVLVFCILTQRSIQAPSVALAVVLLLLVL